MPALPRGALPRGALPARDVVVGKFREFVGVRTYLADRFLLQFHAKLVGLGQCKQAIMRELELERANLKQKLARVGDERKALKMVCKRASIEY